MKNLKQKIDLLEMQLDQDLNLLVNETERFTIKLNSIKNYFFAFEIITFGFYFGYLLAPKSNKKQIHSTFFDRAHLHSRINFLSAIPRSFLSLLFLTVYHMI